MDIEQQQSLAVDLEKVEQTLGHLIALTALSDQDCLILRSSAAQTQQWADEIVTEFYDTLFGYEPTAEVFKKDERPGHEDTLRRWYLEITDGNIDSDYWQRQWRMDMFHNLRQVKSTVTLAMMSRLQQLFLKKCLQEFEPTQAIQVYHAFKRVTDIVAGLVIEARHTAYGELGKLVDDLQNTILPVSIALSTEKNLDRLLEKILIETKLICNADAGTLYLREDDTLKFVIMLTDSLDIALGGTTGREIPFSPLSLHDATTGEPNNRNVATYVTLAGRSINIPDVYHTRQFDFSATKEFDEKNNYHSASSLTVPLKDRDNEVIGVLQLFNAQDPTTGRVTPFDSYQQLVVEALSSQAAVALNTKKLIEHQEMFAKFERDLQIGHQIQVDFLPSDADLPQPDGWEIATYFHPAREVAGDFFDAFMLPGQKIGIVIADVVDKGVGAALFMALSRSLIRAYAQQHHPMKLLDSLGDFGSSSGSSIRQRGMFPTAGLSALAAVGMTNNYIAKNHGDMTMFATLFFGVLDPTNGMLHYINGGHDSPVLISSNGEIKARLNPTGPAVGMMPDMEFDIGQITLEPGDLLMTFSDGVPDARSPSGERFTAQRLMDLLQQAHPISSVTGLLSQIETTVHSHIDTADQFDDITMLGVWRLPNLEGPNDQAKKTA